MSNLAVLGNYAAIGAFVITLVGAIVGLWGYLSYRIDIQRKRKALEDYLAEEKRTGGDQGQRSMLNIIRHVGLTEDEILKISFASDKIDRRLSTKKDDRFADRILFMYVGDD